MPEKEDLKSSAEPLDHWITAPITEAMSDRVTKVRLKMGISRAELNRRALAMYLRKQETR